jgi:hypothetical protein
MDRRPVVNDMNSRREREEELRGLLQTPQGMETIMKLYHQKVMVAGRSTTLGRIGLLACQMIPLIVFAEFPATNRA